MPLLEFKNVSYVSNDNKSIIKNISVEVNAGDFISVVGPSGSGKSTFFKLCAQLISAADGDIIFRNKNCKDYNPLEWRKNIAYCFQTPYLFGNTVMDNLSFPYSIRNMKADLKKAEKLLEMFSLGKEYLHEEVRNLSGGEKQRIALIRTLLFKPEILLLDEVTSALDEDNTQVVEKVIQKLNKENVTILWITHNSEQSRRYANKILTIENGEIKSLEVIR